MSGNGFSKSVIDAVSKRASYICSNPDCGRYTTAPSDNEEKAILIGEVAHITAAASGGPRYDANLTNEKRNNIENAIFLCANCHAMIDKNNGADFEVNQLKTWKIEHELRRKNNLNKRSNNESSTYVTSYGQIGGITSAIVNVNTNKNRGINEDVKKSIIALIPQNKIMIKVVNTDKEAHAYGKLVYEFIESIPNKEVQIEFSLDPLNSNNFEGQQIQPSTTPGFNHDVIIGLFPSNI